MSKNETDEILEEITQNTPEELLDVIPEIDIEEEKTIIIDDDYEATIKYVTDQELADENEKEYDIVG